MNAGNLDQLCSQLGNPDDNLRADIEIALNAYEFASRGGDPRTKILAQKADELEAACNVLAHKIAEFDDVLSRVIMLMNPLYGSPSFEIFQASTEIRDGLDWLSRTFGRARAEITEKLGSGDPDRPDLGGAGGAETALNGNSKMRLAEQLAPIFAECKGAISSTVDGPFHKFLLAAHQAATGNTKASFERELKKSVREFKTRRDAREKVEGRIGRLSVAENLFRQFPQERERCRSLQNRRRRLMDFLAYPKFPRLK